MYCPECGKEVPRGSNFCMYCSADLRQYGINIEVSPHIEPKFPSRLEVTSKRDKEKCEICGERDAVNYCKQCGRRVCYACFFEIGEEIVRVTNEGMEEERRRRGYISRKESCRGYVSSKEMCALCAKEWIINQALPDLREIIDLYEEMRQKVHNKNEKSVWDELKHELIDVKLYLEMDLLKEINERLNNIGR